jgi:AI-2 transport protein TqsA
MINISEQRLQTACLLFIVAVLAAFGAYWLRPVFVPFVVAVFIVSGVSPILEALQRSVASTRLMAAVIAFLTGCLIVAALMAALWASVVDLAENAGAYQTRVEELIEEVDEIFSIGKPKKSAQQDRKAEPVPQESSGNEAEEETKESEDPKSEDPESSKSKLESTPTEEREKTTGTEVMPDAKSKEELILMTVPERMQEFVSSTLKSGFFRISQVLLEMFSASLIVLIYVFFLLLGAPTGASSSQVVQDVDKQIRSYLSLKTIISVLTGFAFGTALWLFGVPMAIAFGMLAFLLNFIPNIGPVIASLLPLPLILLDPEGSVFWMASVLTVTFGIQFVSGNVLEPKIMGQQSDLHPIVVLLALMFWGMLWGIVGMFLATPVTAAIRIGLSQFEQTKFVAELMAGRWPSEKQEEIAAD